MNILKRVPDSVLWLLEYPADAKQNIWKEALFRGVEPSRIIFTPKVPKNEHINRCYLADLALDNAITNGHTTSCDLLWSACPMITFPATENMPSRVAASICCAIGCPEMVAKSFAEYEEMAVYLATNKDQLLALRQKIEKGRLIEPLFDTRRWVRNFESGLSHAWKLYCSQ